MSAIAGMVREAHEASRPLRIFGAGTWLDAGRPTSTADPLSLAEHRGIVEYVPGDLTLTARAGTPLSDIVHATREHGQWLPLDPWGGDAGTLGATISTATAGPHAASMGLPRDVVLGMEFVTGTGTVVRSGGRVVKNVAGFDLTRLLVGSWGTLGVITEATIRLRARPEHSRSVAIDVPLEAAALNELVVRLRALPFVPLATEIVDASLATRLGVGKAAVLLCRVGGNAKSVQGQLDLLNGFGARRDTSEDVWERLRGIDTGHSAAWRWSRLPSHFGDLWSRALQATASLESALVHGNPMRGVVRMVTRGAPDALARAATAHEGSVVIERLPDAAWPLTRTRVATDTVSRAIRAKFDPRGILNPWILGEEAAA